MKRVPKRSSLRERLLSKAIINPETGCWEWAGAKTPSGYGTLRRDGRTVYAHRTAYDLIERAIPAGLVIDHLCRNRACINPAHLEPVSQRENMMRSPVALAALNAQKTCCKHGHEFTSENTYIKPNGGRDCRACRAACSRNYAARRAVSA